MSEIVVHYSEMKDTIGKIQNPERFRRISQTRTNNVDPIVVRPKSNEVYHLSKWLMDKTT